MKIENMTRPAASTMTSESRPELNQFRALGIQGDVRHCMQHLLSCHRHDGVSPWPSWSALVSMYRAKVPELRLAVASADDIPN